MYSKCNKQKVWNQTGMIFMTNIAAYILLFKKLLNQKKSKYKAVIYLILIMA